MASLIDKIKDTKLSPWFVGLCSGLYPILFYAGNNYSLVNSWGHLVFFILGFLVLPGIIAAFGAYLLKKISASHWIETWLAFIGFGLFFFFIKVTLLEAPHRKITAAILLLAAVYAYFLEAHHRKFMVLQVLMGFLALVPLAGQVIHNLSLSEAWKEIDDEVLSAEFINKPNIYLIQPDGLVNFSELNIGYYNYQDTTFAAELGSDASV